ncbi:MAG TPA: hypothetical protein VIR33_16070 [Thermopolyspora sp.]
MSKASGPPVSVEGVDHALGRRRIERDRISGDLLDLEGHPGHQLLKGAELGGVTQQRWAEAQAKLVTLWWLFDGYRRVIDRAEQVRARRADPGPDELTELTALLTGSSVELKAEDVPVERRSLIAAAGEWLTLDEIVARMDGLYQDVARTVAAADAAWTALLPAIEKADAARRTAEGLLVTLGGDDPELEHLGRVLADARQDVRGDPLSFAAAGDAAFDTSRLERLAADLAARRDLLQEAARIQGEFDTRDREMTERIEEIKSAEDAARAARDQVLVKIADPILPHLPDQAPALGDRLASLATLRGQGAWTELARRMSELDQALTEALRQAHEAASAITALLDRRDELRGRLDAYRAKALRLGQAEDDELIRLYRRARDLLWTAPCDLRQATRAVAGYRRALSRIGADG